MTMMIMMMMMMMMINYYLLSYDSILHWNNIANNDYNNNISFRVFLKKKVFIYLYIYNTYN